MLSLAVEIFVCYLIQQILVPFPVAIEMCDLLDQG